MNDNIEVNNTQFYPFPISFWNKDDKRKNEIISKFNNRLKPISKEKFISFPLLFTNLQYEMITYGILSIDMDCKWDIVFEDNWLHFYRSWTLFEWFKCYIYKDIDNIYKIDGFYVETTDTEKRPSNRFKDGTIASDEEVITRFLEPICYQLLHMTVKDLIGEDREANLIIDGKQDFQILKIRDVLNRL